MEAARLLWALQTVALVLGDLGPLPQPAQALRQFLQPARLFCKSVKYRCYGTLTVLLNIHEQRFAEAVIGGRSGQCPSEH